MDGGCGCGAAKEGPLLRKGIGAAPLTPADPWTKLRQRRAGRARLSLMLGHHTRGTQAREAAARADAWDDARVAGSGPTAGREAAGPGRRQRGRRRWRRRRAWEGTLDKWAGGGAGCGVSTKARAEALEADGGGPHGMTRERPAAGRRRVGGGAGGHMG